MPYTQIPTPQQIIQDVVSNRITPEQADEVLRVMLKDAEGRDLLASLLRSVRQTFRSERR